MPYLSNWAPPGAPKGVQKQNRFHPGSKVRENLNSVVFLREYIGFSWSRGGPGGSGMVPRRCLRDHFSAPRILRESFRVPGHEFGAP